MDDMRFLLPRQEVTEQSRDKVVDLWTDIIEASQPDDYAATEQ